MIMEKITLNTNDIKVRNPMAKALGSGQYGQRIIKNRKAYDRKRNRKIED